MGTSLRVSVEAPDRATALAATEVAIAAVIAAEARLSTWRSTSELSRVNALPVGRTVSLSPRLARDLAGAFACSRMTDGAFAPGMGSLVEAWGLRSGGRLPTDAEIERARSASGLEHVRFDGAGIERLDDRFRFEEGAFGKGVGLDDATAALGTTAAISAVIDLGGQVAVWGKSPRAVVGIADPRQRERVVLQLDVPRGSIATTGNSERGIVVDGVRVGHVLDPRTGRPSNDFGSMTVWTETAATADCLSTALYVLGPSAALRWAASRREIAVVAITATESGLVASASPSLRHRLTSVVDDLELRFETLPSPVAATFVRERPESPGPLPTAEERRNALE